MIDEVVLVVDDEADILGIVGEVLSLEGFLVHTASNGLEALQQIRREQPGLVLLDMRMPVMDGWQFATQLRSQYSTRVPVLVMTAAKDARARAREIEAEGYISKPFDIDDLVEKVRRHMRQ